MQGLNGFIKIHRKLIQWGWYQDNVVKGVFLHILLTANFKPQPWQGIVIERGQLVTSYGHLANDLGFTVQQVRTALNKLKSTQEITIKTTNKYSLITIANWEEYQDSSEVATSTSTQCITNEQQTNNNQITINQQQRKNDKNDKNEKKEKNNIYTPTADKSAFGDFQNVFLSEKEYEKLKNQFSDFEYKINELSEYMESTGKKYKSHYATIVSWDRKNNKKNDVSKTSFWEVDLND